LLAVRRSGENATAARRVGTHVFRIRNGRVSYFHAYEDTEKVARACERMAALGIEEAAAPPIVD
jgi:ketosteroid isomerase-like protein